MALCKMFAILIILIRISLKTFLIFRKKILISYFCQALKKCENNFECEKEPEIFVHQ